MISSVEEFYLDLAAAYQAGKEGRVEAFLRDCLKNVCPCCGKGNDLYLAVVNEAGTFYQNTGKYDTALGLWEKASFLIMDAYGADSLEYTANISHIADTCRLMGDGGRALQTFERVLELYEKSVGRENYFYASTLNSISLTFQGMGDLARAADYASRAMEILKQLDGFRQELATAHVNLSALFRQQGKNEEAQELLDQALRLFEETGESCRSYAAALSGKASFLYAQGNYAQAEKLYREALEQTAAFAGSSADCGVLYVNLAHVAGKLGQAEETLRYLRRAQRIYETVYGRAHKATQRVTRQLDSLRRKIIPQESKG